ncbi:hypothetical protein GCM10009623_26500 [Nocardioides aestuarii]|uniref:Uncharacterized protein n=1 Tax=Nocardioides aestuarii TaxID=252231 RepID=A0ABW4TPW0_9ACTN
MTFRPIIRTQQDLEDAWRELMGPLGFTRTSIWLMLIEADGTPIPQLSKIEAPVAVPIAAELDAFTDMVGGLVREFVPGGRVAFLRSRPGAPGLTVEDRAWAQALYAAGRAAGVPVEVVHRACDSDLVPVPMDESVPDSAA